MRFVIFTHSLVSDWNHGNAHFLRGIARELIEQGVVSLLQIAIVLTMLFFYNARLAWLSLLPLPFLVAGALCYTLTAHRRYKLQRTASSAIYFERL